MTSDDLRTALMAALVHADSVPKEYMPYDAQATAVLAVVADAMRGLRIIEHYSVDGDVTAHFLLRDDVLALVQPPRPHDYRCTPEQCYEDCPHRDATRPPVPESKDNP